MVCPGRNLCRVPEEQREVLRTKWRTGDCTGVYDGEERLEMEISLLLMEEIAKLFAIMLMGYAVVKAGLMKSSESKSVSVIMVYLVIPLVQELLGQEYVIYSSAYIAVQLILIWTHCKNMLCEEDKLEWKKVLLNVNIISIIVGVVLFIGRIQLPSGVQDVMNMMNNMIGPIGMLLAGMVIAEVPLKTVFNRKRNYVSTALRLIVYPIFVLFLMKIICAFIGIMDAKQILLTVYLASVTPPCATVTSMAQLYDKDAAYASSLYVLTTLLSIVTMPVMVGSYEMMA